MDDTETLKQIFKQRLKNMINKKGDDYAHELSLEVMKGIEREFKITLSEEKVQILDDIVEEYKETGIIN